MNTEKKIAAFHIGRGGRFHNAGHRSFIGFKKIGEFTADLFLTYEKEQDFKNRFGFEKIQELISNEDFDDLEELFGITIEMLGEQIYTDGSGNAVGLTYSESELGIGTINIDHEYDTTYCKFVDDCTEEELRLIEKN